MSRAICTTIAAAGIGAALLNPAAAVTSLPAGSLLPTYGDPFPTGTVIDLFGGPYTTQFGTFDEIQLSNFTGCTPGCPGPNPTYVQNGTDQFFTYTDVTFTLSHQTNNTGIPGPLVIPGGTVEVELFGRTSLTQLGTFAAVLLEANFSGNAYGHVLAPQLLGGGGSGWVHYVYDGLAVGGFAFNVPNAGYTVDGGPFISTPLTTTPLPAALPMFGAGLGLVGWLARRRKARGTLVAA
jgi:hypothetical protein